MFKKFFHIPRLQEAIDYGMEAARKLESASYDNVRESKRLKISLAQSGDMGISNVLEGLGKKRD